MNICVYCASSADICSKYIDEATVLGRKLAENGFCLVNGAGRTGLMRACSDAVMAHGGRAVGVIPRFMVERGWCADGLSEVIVTEDMHERKRTMAHMADGCVALPGGCGTFEELMEVITWKQMGLYDKPVVILNVDGYYDPLLDMLGKAVGEGFMRQEHADLWSVASTAAEAVELIVECLKRK